MFKKLIQELQNFDTISIPIEADSDGYIDKECPSKECLFEFKVNSDDWSNLFKDEQVFCPMCRNEANSDSWWTTEQIENAKEQAQRHVVSKITNALNEGAEEFNQKNSKNSFLNISIKVKGGVSKHQVIPIPSKESLELKIQCNNCSARFSVIGSAFFCPCCGYNSAEQTFDQSLGKIEIKIKSLEYIRNGLQDVSKDDKENICRSLIENSIGECVMAFQRFCEVKYSKMITTVDQKPNDFQNLDKGAKHWKRLFGTTYDDWITGENWSRLVTLYQRRHLLAHKEGFVDDKYILNSRDNSYKVGQRIVVKETDVLDLVALVKELYKNINHNADLLTKRV